MMRLGDRELDERLVTIIYSMVIFNGIPLLLFILYIILSSTVIFASALLVQLVTFLFGLAIFAPVALFTSMGALTASFTIIGVKRFLLNGSNLPAHSKQYQQQQLKVD
ncbi:unnamed protein product [Gongylonema pulchrum]|uniref:Transmembrane protein n=1 Tax=Gongylonema pulchrum TaxID=637853 RepID=A0A183CXI4_9BILA|nr:unnamed protein product [Gongylonema pulchrum]